MLRVAKMLERRAWYTQHPLRQTGGLPHHIYAKLEDKRASLDTLRELPASEVGALISNQRLALAVKQEVRRMVWLGVEVVAQPITRTVLRVNLTLTPSFEWSDRQHGGAEPWWLWVEDTENEHIYHKELWLLSKPMANQPQVRLCAPPRLWRSPNRAGAVR